MDGWRIIVSLFGSSRDCRHVAGGITADVPSLPTTPLLAQSSPGTPEHDSASSPEPESLKPRPARLSWGDDEASRQPSRQDRRPSESWSASSRDSRGPETSRHQDPWGQQRSRSLAVDDAPIGRDERWRSNEDRSVQPCLNPHITPVRVLLTSYHSSHVVDTVPVVRPATERTTEGGTTTDLGELAYVPLARALELIICWHTRRFVQRTRSTETR